MEYIIKGQEIRETACIFRGRVNDVMVADKTASDNENEHMIIKVKDIETSKKMAEMFGEYRKKDFITFCAGDNFCIWTPYMQSRKITEYIYSVTETYDEIAEICKALYDRVFFSDLPNSFMYLILKERKINISEEKRIYFTYDLDLDKLEDGIEKKECARELGYIIEELISDEKYSEFTIVKLMKKKNSQGGYESFRELIDDIKNMRLLGKVEKKFDKIKDFILTYEIVMAKIAIAICLIVVCVAGVIYFWDKIDLNSSFDIIGTENLTIP